MGKPDPLLCAPALHHGEGSQDERRVRECGCGYGRGAGSVYQCVSAVDQFLIFESLQEQLGTESKEAVEQHIQALADHMQDLDKAFQTAKNSMKNATHAGRI